MSSTLKAAKFICKYLSFCMQTCRSSDESCDTYKRSPRVILAFISLKKLSKLISSTKLRFKSFFASGLMWVSSPLRSNARTPSCMFCRMVSTVVFWLRISAMDSFSPSAILVRVEAISPNSSPGGKRAIAFVSPLKSSFVRAFNSVSGRVTMRAVNIPQMMTAATAGSAA